MSTQAARAICMIRGKGVNVTTQYSCQTVEKAKEQGVKILIIKNGKRSHKEPRIVHRRDLFDTYSDNHELAGNGKYIDKDAFNGTDYKHVHGAQYVNPYLKKHGVYWNIIEVF